MIIKKKEKDGIIKGMYSSSTICASVYETQTKKLTVIFNNGGQYSYDDVSLSDYIRFETAESNGSIFNKFIKNNYKFTKLDNIPTETLEFIMKEVNAETISEKDKETKEINNDKEVIRLMMGMMVSILNDYINEDKVNNKLINELSTIMNSYKS